MTFPARCAALALLTLAAPALAKVKILENKNYPGSVPGLAEAIARAKDPRDRIAMGLLLDEKLREKGAEVTDPALVAPAFELVLDGALSLMAGPGEVWTWDGQGSSPRADVLCRQKVLAFPGRLPANFSKSYTKKLEGKKLDRGLQGQSCTLEVTVAPTEADWHKTIEAGKTWGLIVHTASRAEGVMRLGLHFVSPSASTSSAPARERPALVGFVRAPKKSEEGVAWVFVDVPPILAKDWREQEVNLVTAQRRPSDAERRARLAAWAEDVRTLNPDRKAWLDSEQRLFLLRGFPLDKKELGLLDRYRTHGSALVHAAVELKRAELLNTLEPDTFAAAVEGLPLYMKDLLVLELLKQVNGPLEIGAEVSAVDLAEIKKAIASDSRVTNAEVKAAKGWGAFAKVQVEGLARPFVLVHRTEAGWVVLGEAR